MKSVDLASTWMYAIAQNLPRTLNPPTLKERLDVPKQWGKKNQQ